MRLFRRLLVSTLIAWVAADAWSAVAQEAAEPRLPPKERFHLFLLVGQSNMAGRGAVEEQDRKPHPRVLTFTQGEEWAPAVDPLHFDKPAAVGVGLGRTFGIQVAEALPEVTVGLIPCAAGGSPIGSWEPGGFHSQTNSHPYDDALRRAQAALESGALKGILWHQGESDANPDLAGVYESKLHALVNRFRRGLQAPHAPFLVGQMGQFAERPWSTGMRKVDAAHRRLPQVVENAAFISSKGLSHKGDQVHFDAESYRELGRRYARAYLRMTEKSQ